jgi:hypothetical protein
MSPPAPCGSCCCCYLCCLLLATLLLLVLSAPLQSTKLLPSPSNCLTKQQPAHWPDLWAFEGMSAHTHQKSTDPPKVSSGLVSIFRNDGSSPPAFPPLRSSAHLPSRRSQLLSCFRRVIEQPSSMRSRHLLWPCHDRNEMHELAMSKSSKYIHLPAIHQTL